ncbi:GMC oxidoreductase [Xylaria arbuscula]|nr:GMC oxidoreductase [Xylaria arbuscula]
MKALYCLSVSFTLCAACECLAFVFLVAGGGTAGLVIANRLSEDPSISVAVIEPGDDVRNDSLVLDVDLAGISFSPLLDRPTAFGSPGWDWNALLPYFLRSEQFAIPTSAQRGAGITYLPQYHGEDGYLKTGHPYQIQNSSFHSAAQEACEPFGLLLNRDLNSGKTRGFGAYPQTLDRNANVRESSARAYYEPIDKRPNFQIIKGTVKRITFNDCTAGNELIASGFEYTDDQDNLVSITAKREVILSTGTFVSPLILEASGIGNPRVLANNGIKTKIALPGTGEGFQEQPLWALMFQSSANLSGHVPFAAFATAEDIFGAETSSIAASTSNQLASWAEAVSKRLGGDLSVEALKTRFQVQHDVIFKENASVAEFEFFSLGTMVGSVFSPTLPFSWGSVHLDSSGDVNNPVIDSNFLSLDLDIQTAMGAGRLSRELWSTQSLDKFTATFLVPGDSVLPPNATDTQWTKYLTSSCVSASHGVGTCAMLPRELGGVVDPTLKVYGTNNIRVVDASVIPNLMSGHPSAAVYAVAEKAADIIKEGFSPGNCPLASGLVSQS